MGLPSRGIWNLKSSPARPDQFGGRPGGFELTRWHFLDIAVWLGLGGDGDISPEWDEWMGGTPMLVMVAFKRNPAIGQLHPGPSGPELDEGLM
jgi:hypothetical protein